ncbi:MAG: type II toxin-antitoxin system RelE/ParE family toxin [Terriglobia bacterium]
MGGPPIAAAEDNENGERLAARLKPIPSVLLTGIFGSRCFTGDADIVFDVCDQEVTDGPTKRGTVCCLMLEALKGNRQGQHSIRINGQWRICFVWRDGNAYDVEIVDYH